MGYSWVNADSYDAEYWTDPENANDGDYDATFSVRIIGDRDWESYTYVLSTPKPADRIKFKVSRNNTKISLCKIEVHEIGGDWETVHEQDGPWGSIATVEFDLRVMDQWRLSFFNSSFATNYNAHIYDSQLGANDPYWVNDTGTLVDIALRSDVALVAVP